MNMTERLKLMQEMTDANKARDKEFVKTPAFPWCVDYAFIDAEGNNHETEPTDGNRLLIYAPTLNKALESAEILLGAMAEKDGWKKWMIWDVGIGADVTLEAMLKE